MKFIAEISYYSLCFIAFLFMKIFCSIPQNTANIIYIAFMLVSFGYLIILSFSGLKRDPVKHGKQIEKNFIPRKGYENKSFNRGNIKSVVVLWLIYLLVLGILKYVVAISWELFLCGACFMFGLNSFFCRKKCLLSKWFLKKNGCCNDCGINGWDLAIFASALAFAPDMSLVARVLNMVIIIIAFFELIIWEQRYFKYPYRFHKSANQNLSCENCTKKCKKIKDVC